MFRGCAVYVSLLSLIVKALFYPSLFQKKKRKLSILDDHFYSLFLLKTKKRSKKERKNNTKDRRAFWSRCWSLFSFAFYFSVDTESRRAHIKLASLFFFFLVVVFVVAACGLFLYCQVVTPKHLAWREKREKLLK